MTSELIGWNLDGWYDEASAADMAVWYSKAPDVDDVHLVNISEGRVGIVYHGQPFTFWHSGRDRSGLSEGAKRVLNLREVYLHDETEAGLNERLYAAPGDKVLLREVRRERRRRAALEERDIAGTTPAPASTPEASVPACVTRYNAEHTWAELLEGDGWTFHHRDRDGADHWTRPGKQARKGSSATTNLGGLDMLYVFTSSIPWLPMRDRGRGYDRFGYMVLRDYAGDFGEAVSALNKPDRSASSTPIENFTTDRSK